MLEPDFCQRYNGLMLRSGHDVRQVYCAVFPSPEVLARIVDDRVDGSLLFLHHPIDFEVGGQGFLPISPENLRAMLSQQVSVYTCHGPLDCYDAVGTAAAIVEAFDVSVEDRFCPCGDGYAGRIGSIAAATRDELVAKGRAVFGVERVEIGGASPESIARVATIGGGPPDIDQMRELEDRGAQALITGEWYSRTSPEDPGIRAWCEANRAANLEYAEASEMALLAFSHAASEFLVMRTQMAAWFRENGLPVNLLPQSDWWR